MLDEARSFILFATSILHPCVYSVAATERLAVDIVDDSSLLRSALYSLDDLSDIAK
jgi:hypothetical protein